MIEIERDYETLQRDYGGNYVARNGDTVLASAPTYEGLCKQLDDRKLDPRSFLVEYVEPAGVIVFY